MRVSSTIEHRCAPAERTRAHHRLGAAQWACGLSLLAAAGHAVVAPSHFAEWWAYGAFFATAAAGQGAFAALVLVRRWTWLLLVGIAGNVAIVGMYVVSRTNGVALGPHAHVERVGVFDLTCTAYELGVIVACVGLLPPALARRTATVLMAAGMALWTARFAGLLA